MDNAELLSHFENRVDEFEKIQGFIEKAKGQASKFAASVVEKVIRTNTEKTEAIVEELIPLMSDMDTVVESLESAKAEIVEGQQQSKLLLEELELRLLIQELTEEEFETDSVGLKKELAETDEKIAEIDAELAKFRSQLDRWQALGESAGVLDSGEAPVEEEPQAEAAEEESVELESLDIEAEEVLAAVDEALAADVDEAPAPDEDDVVDDLEPLEAVEDDFEEVVFDDGGEDDLVDVEGFSDDEPVEVAAEINQVAKHNATEDLSAVFADDDDIVELEAAEADEAEEAVELEMGEARQAVLIYSEGARMSRYIRSMMTRYASDEVETTTSR